VGFSDIVTIRNKILALRRQGAEVFQFEGGEPFINTPDPIKEACIKALSENKTRYAPSSGLPELLDAMANKLRTKNKIAAERDNVIVVNGGLHGLFVAFSAVVNPGDEVLLLSPYWTPVRDLIGLTGGERVLVDTYNMPAGDIRLALERHLTEKTRMIYFNTPTNPTGRVYRREEIEALADFAQQHNLVVIADEAYEDIIFDHEHISIASLPGMMERTLTVYTMSKSYAMTGWRVGYVVAAEPWMTGLRKITLNSINGVNTPTQWAAVTALTMDQSFMDECRRGYRQRRDLLVNGLRSIGFECEMPHGAFYAFPRFAGLFSGKSWDVFNLLLESAGVATVPGAVFGEHGEGHLRLSFSTTLETIEAGLERLKKLRMENGR
jgi:aspartate aminotransferase